MGFASGTGLAVLTNGDNGQRIAEELFQAISEVQLTRCPALKEG